MHLLNIENYNPLRMKTQYSLLTILFGVYLLFPFGSTAQGKVLEGLTLESKIMKAALMCVALNKVIPIL